MLTNQENILHRKTWFWGLGMNKILEKINKNARLNVGVAQKRDQ